MEEYRISQKGIKAILALVCFSLFFVSIASPSSLCFAEHRLVKPEWVMPKHYPEWFHGWGRIGYISETEIVINDFSFPLSPYANFHTPDTPNASRRVFVPGKLAGFLFDSEDVIVSVWLITMD